MFGTIIIRSTDTGIDNLVNNYLSGYLIVQVIRHFIGFISR